MRNENVNSFKIRQIQSKFKNNTRLPYLFRLRLAWNRLKQHHTACILFSVGWRDKEKVKKDWFAAFSHFIRERFSKKISISRQKIFQIIQYRRLRSIYYYGEGNIKLTSQKSRE